MADTKSNALSASGYYSANTEGKRILAVSAALELIAARASNSTPFNLEPEFNNLSKYADQIQEAINKK
jgi:hypothetical protein